MVHPVQSVIESLYAAGRCPRLHVNATGQPVAKGQPLFEAYSPELVSAQREYAIAMQGLEAMKDAPKAIAVYKEIQEKFKDRSYYSGAASAYEKQLSAAK